MAKKSGTATPEKVKQQRANAAKVKGEGDDLQEAFNFDLAAIEAEAEAAAKAVREKHLAPARERLTAATAERDQLDAEIERLSAILNGGRGTVKAKAAKGRGAKADVPEPTSAQVAAAVKALDDAGGTLGAADARRAAGYDYLSRLFAEGIEAGTVRVTLKGRGGTVERVK